MKSDGDSEIEAATPPAIATEKVVASAVPSLALLLAFAGIFVPLLLFGALADDVWTQGSFQWDPPLLRRLHSHASAGFDWLMLIASMLGSLIVMLPIVAGIALILWVVHRRADAAFLLRAVAGACLLNLGAKVAFGRARPDLWVSIAPESDYSFPSGHAMLSMAVVASLLVLLWRSPLRRTWQIIGALSGMAFVGWIGLSRLYLGVHFPSDVLAGWCASLAWVSGVELLRRASEARSAPGWRETLESARRSLRRELQALKLLRQDPRTPPISKVLLGAALAYAVLPFDLIPDFIPVIGHLDDLILVPGLVALAIALVPEDVVSECRALAETTTAGFGAYLPGARGGGAQ